LERGIWPNQITEKFCPNNWYWPSL